MLLIWLFSEFIRDVKPGEMLVFENITAEPKSMMWSKRLNTNVHCIFWICSVPCMQVDV